MVRISLTPVRNLECNMHITYDAINAKYNIGVRIIITILSILTQSLQKINNLLSNINLGYTSYTPQYKTTFGFACLF